MASPPAAHDLGSGDVLRRGWRDRERVREPLRVLARREGHRDGSRAHPRVRGQALLEEPRRQVLHLEPAAVGHEVHAARGHQAQGRDCGPRDQQAPAVSPDRAGEVRDPGVQGTDPGQPSRGAPLEQDGHEHHRGQEHPKRRGPTGPSHVCQAAESGQGQAKEGPGRGEGPHREGRRHRGPRLRYGAGPIVAGAHAHPNRLDEVDPEVDAQSHEQHGRGRGQKRQPVRPHAERGQAPANAHREGDQGQQREPSHPVDHHEEQRHRDDRHPTRPAQVTGQHLVRLDQERRRPGELAAEAVLAQGPVHLGYRAGRRGDVRSRVAQYDRSDGAQRAVASQRNDRGDRIESGHLGRGLRELLCVRLAQDHDQSVRGGEPILHAAERRHGRVRGIEQAEHVPVHLQSGRAPQGPGRDHCRDDHHKTTPAEEHSRC